MTITVTAQDDDYPEDKASHTIWDDYVLVCAGSAEMTYTTVHNKRDGTSTHTIIVKGVRRPTHLTSGSSGPEPHSGDESRQGPASGTGH